MSKARCDNFRIAARPSGDLVLLAAKILPSQTTTRALDHIDATFRVSGATGAYVALKFAGIGRTPQFAIGTSLSCVGGFAATQRKTRRSPKGQNIVAGVAREATYLETWWRCRFGNEPERQQRRIGFPMTHHALIAILFCTGVWAFLVIVLADSRVPKVPRVGDDK